MQEHMSTQELRDYREKQLPTERLREIRLHLDSCAVCFQEFENLSVVDFFASYLDDMQHVEPDHLHPPEEAMKRFQEGTITDQIQKESILDHFLHCKPCYDKFLTFIKKAVFEEQEKGSSESIFIHLPDPLIPVLSSMLNPEETKPSDWSNSLQQMTIVPDEPRTYLGHNEESIITTFPGREDRLQPLGYQPDYTLRATIDKSRNILKLQIKFSSIQGALSKRLSVLLEIGSQIFEEFTKTPGWANFEISLPIQLDKVRLEVRPV